MKTPVRHIGDDERLTQYGVIGEPFRNAPRWDQETELSVCAANHSVPEPDFRLGIR